MLTIESVTNLKWCDVEKVNLECQVKYAEFNEPHPTGVNAACPDLHIKEIWTKALTGEYGIIQEYAPFVPEAVVAAPAELQPTAVGTQEL